MDAMKEFMSEEEIGNLFKSVDTDSNGYLHFTDFIAATLEAAGPPVGLRACVEDVFDRMDVERCGLITEAGLMALMGSSLSPRGAQRMLSEEGLDTIDFESFRKLLAHISDSLQNSVHGQGSSNSLGAVAFDVNCEGLDAVE